MRQIWIVSGVATLGLAVGLGCPVAAEADSARTYTWTAAVLEVDAGAPETVLLQAGMTKAAMRGLDGLRRGDEVLLRWRGRTPGTGHQITGVTATRASSGPPKVAIGRGHFAMRAGFIGVDRTRRLLTFTVPGGPAWREALDVLPSGGWVRVTSSIDRHGEVRQVTSVEPLHRPSVER